MTRKYVPIERRCIAIAPGGGGCAKEARHMIIFDRDGDYAKGAVLSDDGMYRYSLARNWDAGALPLTFIMLNPSTADAYVDDPTIRRCIGFARDHAFGGIHVINLYAFRATKPADMFRAIDPVGPDNDQFFDIDPRGTVVAAWGVNARADRVRQVMRLLEGRNVFCLGKTKDGHPRHPLYVRADQRFETFKGVS